MKKLLLIPFLIVGTCLFAQESNNDYNKWSLEVSGGFHKPTRPFANNYYVDTPDLWQAAIGARYMFNDRFGLKLDFNYHDITEGSDSRSFKSEYFRTSLQGVVNLGSVLHFENWTKSIGLLVHGGMGYSQLNPKEPNKLKNSDQMMNFIAGISPQVRLSNRVALTADLSMIGHIRQDITWDGTAKPGVVRGFNSYMTTASIGLNFYLGKHEKHADWVEGSSLDNERLSSLEARIAKIETDMLDSDQDGVPDYLDQEPNSAPGAIVDTKGRTITKDTYDIPGYMEEALDARYARKGKGETGEDMIVRQLIDSGLINVFFPFNSTKPHAFSAHAMNYVIKYMNDNPSAKIELVGYSDEIGNANYNQGLSERRAKVVYNVLLAAGISADRLSYRGAGEDSSVDKNSEYARQLVRRVIFELK